MSTPVAPVRTTVELPEGPLSLLSAGERGSPVVLLGGGGVNNALISWGPLLEDLAATHRVVALDWPKQGRSRPWNGVADHAGLMEVVDAVLDHCGFERAHLVGLSQGGAVALAQAIARPGRVERVVALAPGGVGSYAPGLHQLLWLSGRSRLLHTRVPSLFTRRRSQVAALARRVLFAGPVADFDEVVSLMWEEVRQNGAGPSDWQKASLNPWGVNVDLRPHLGRVLAPTLFLQGDRDVVVSPRDTIAAMRRVPGARLRMVRGHGHWLQRQSPGLVNALVRDFLDQHSPGAGPGVRGCESPV
ncbi:alpha/beta fold hydrolase [Nocardiopsis kunsanensis]|uniref:alpha/beta fold hydrolase n=1 Tax=Nocardiopsis kunsanensis TaxID=141693 RepID=UPI0004781E62|nr:alpha/beta hydrolase [Nocardiopsis kunsanensis]